MGIAMKIIWTNASEEEMNRDAQEVMNVHLKAKEQDPLWKKFGGTITVNNRQYQVQ
jgi:hypothetical protein